MPIWLSMGELINPPYPCCFTACYIIFQHVLTEAGLKNIQHQYYNSFYGYKAKLQHVHTCFVYNKDDITRQNNH